jgi:hypothetical protein
MFGARLPAELGGLLFGGANEQRRPGFASHAMAIAYAIALLISISPSYSILSAIPATNWNKTQNVDASYDIFEILPDGSPLWKGVVIGRDAALKELESLAENCENELRVIHLPTKAVVATRPSRAEA